MKSLCTIQPQVAYQPCVRRTVALLSLPPRLLTPCCEIRCGRDSLSYGDRGRLPLASAFPRQVRSRPRDGNCPIQDPLRRVDPLAVLEALEATVHSARADDGDSHAVRCRSGLRRDARAERPLSSDVYVLRLEIDSICMDGNRNGLSNQMRQALAEVARQLHPASGSIRGLREDFSRWAMEALLPSKVRHNTSAALLVERWRQAAARNELNADTAGYLPGSVTNAPQVISCDAWSVCMAWITTTLLVTCHLRRTALTRLSLDEKMIRIPKFVISFVIVT